MQKSQTALFGVLVLSMLTSYVAIAVPTHPNEVGLYTTPDGYGATGTYEIGIPVDVFLVLTKPTDMVIGVPYSNIRGFECQLNFSPVGGLFLLNEILPPNSINIGDNSHLGDGYLEYIVGVPDEMLVTDESVVLIQFTFLNNNAGPVEVTLNPTSVPCNPNEMNFVSYEFGEPYYCTIMHPVSGSHDDPVFIFNGEAVAVEQESFGKVKALYR